MKDGVYMLQETGEIIVLLSCSWTKEYGFLMTKLGGYKVSKTQKLKKVFDKLYYIGDYI